MSMDAFASKVRTFDAFPKVSNEHTVRSQRGGFSTLMTMFCALLIFWVEVGGYIGGYVDRQFSVDDEIKSDLQINVDMLVAMPCEFLHTNVMDITNDRYLAGETLNFQGATFFIPGQFSINDDNYRGMETDLDEVMRESIKAEYSVVGARIDEGAPACHIFGSIPVNHVKGHFHITGKGFGYRDRLSVPFEALNFSHVIQEFSYGEFYPFLNNPLDATGRTTDEKLQAFRYYTKVVPTMYEKLGLEVDTYQYSLTALHHTYNLDHFNRPTGVPGIYFNYDFEPIKLIITEKRLSFFQFVARLGTILGGLLIAAGYIYRLYEKLLVIVFGKKYVRKDTEKKGGLLDGESPSKDY